VIGNKGMPVTIVRGGLAEAITGIETGDAWTKTCQALKHELGEATFGSWLGQAALKEQGAGICLVAATGVARDWIRRHAWRRIGELWAQNDPMGRHLDLKSRMEFEALGGASPMPAASKVIEISVPQITTMQTAPVRVPVRHGLQERFTFDTFVQGPANEFAFAVARRVASWADGHFNPVLFHGPYGFGKTHLLNAMAGRPCRQGSRKRWFI